MFANQRLPFLVFAAFLAGWAVVFGMAWIPQTPSHEELIAYADKFDWLRNAWQTGGLGWWIDGYLGGFSGAAVLSYAVSLLPYAVLAIGLPTVVAFKVGGLILWVLGGLAAWALGRRVSGCAWTAGWIGLLYAFSAQVLLRLSWQEHMTIVTTFPLIPLCFLALLRVAERGAVWDALLLAASFSLTLLCWSKMGATLAVFLAVYAVGLFLTRPNSRAFLLRGALWATPATLLLGVLPLLPVVREYGFMTIFELGPFAGWQAMYSAKTAASWLDRGGDLFQFLPLAFRVDRGGYFLGFVPLAAVALLIFRTWKCRERVPAGFRMFLGLALGAFWVSHGPRSVIGGHFEFLSNGMALADAAIPLPWMMFFAPAVVIWWMLPGGRARPAIFTAVVAVYYFVPGFRLLESLPGFGHLRAPDSFWILNGTICWAVAGGIAISWCLRSFISARLTIPVAALVVSLIVADASANWRGFFSPGLSPELYRDFEEAMLFLKNDPRPGRVMALSGRYFYLGTPGRSERPLSSEAAHHNFMLRDTARLEAASRSSLAAMRSYLNLAGISHVLMDRTDTSVRADADNWLQALLPIAYENASFGIYENVGALYPGFFATHSRPVRNSNPSQVLNEAASGLLLIDTATGPEYSAEARTDDVKPFDPIQPIEATAGQAAFLVKGRSGTLVLSQAWHPDWAVFVNGIPRDVQKAAGAFPAVPIRAGDEVAVFKFLAPPWYFLSLFAGGAAWVFVLLALVVTPTLPALRRRWMTSRVPSAFMQFDSVRPPILRPLAVVPTFNESESIGLLLDRILALPRGIGILVVDDGSPDGTADRVEAHPEFGSRVFLIRRAEKLGLGTAYRAGFQWAIERGYDACIEIDADFSHNPDDIPRLLDALDSGRDAAVGSRYLGGVRVLDWPQHRLFLSLGASNYVRVLTGLPLTDATSGFKAIRSSALSMLPSDEFRGDGYAFQIELHWLLWSRGFRIGEIPIIFTERRDGQTKMSRQIAIEAALRVIQLALTPKPEIRNSAEEMR